MTVAETTALLGCKASLVYSVRFRNKEPPGSQATLFAPCVEEITAPPVAVLDQLTDILMKVRKIDAERHRLRAALLKIEAVLSDALG